MITFTTEADDEGGTIEAQRRKWFMPEIKAQITTGNLIQIVAMIVALAVGWSALDARTVQTTTELADHEARIRSLERDVISGIARIEQRLIQLERLIPHGRNPP